MADAQLSEYRTADYDTTGATDYVEIMGIVVPSATGAQPVANDGANGLAVGGPVAHDAVDAGAPVKVGGKVTAINPTGVAVADRVDAHFDSKGRLGVFIASAYDGTGAVTGNTPADAFTATAGLNTNTWPSVFNGTTWDRHRSAAGVTGVATVGGLTASDAVLAIAPITVGARASTAVPTAVSADGDVVDLRALRTGALTVHMVDAAGAAASIGGGTQYAEDVALGAAGTGTIALGRASTATPSAMSADGDAVAMWLTRNGATVVAGDTAAAATDAGNPVKIGGIAASSSSPADIYTNGQRSALITDLKGRLYVNLASSASTVATQPQADSATSGTLTTGTSTVTSTAGTRPYITVTFNGTYGAATGVFELSDDGGTTWFPIAGIRTDGTAVESTFFQLTNVTRAWQFNALTGNQNFRVRATALSSGTVTVRIHVSSLPSAAVIGAMAYAQGDTAHDAVDTGNPVKIGGLGTSVTPIAVAANDRVNAWYTVNGIQVVQLGTTVSGAGSDGQNVAAMATESNFAYRPFPSVVFNGTNWDRKRSGGVTGMTGVSGDTAHDAVDAGNPIKIGGRAGTGLLSSVSGAGDRVDAAFTMGGAQMVALGASLVTSGDGDTDTNTNALILGFNNSGSGRLMVRHALFNGTSWDRPRSAAGVTGSTAVGGLTASDAAIASAPVTIGARASTAVPTAVSADGDVVDLRALRTGALTVHMVDAAGAAASLGGGTQYVEDVAFGGNGTGSLMIARRDDALATLTPVEDDAVGLRVNSRGALWTALVDSAGAQVNTGVQYIEDGAITANLGQGTLVVARRDDALSTLTPVEDDAVGLRVGSKGALWTLDQRAPTGTTSNVSASASSVTLLAANGARLGAAIWNDSSAILYAKFGATASTSSFTVRMASQSYYEVPFGYTGIIDGIWASAAGSARVTELS